MDTETEPHDLERLGDASNHVVMGVEFLAGLVNGAKRCSGKLQLSAGLEGDAGAILLQPDDIPVIEDGLSVSELRHLFQQLANAALARVTHRAVISRVETDLFVLGPHPPTLGWLLPRTQIRDEGVDGFDGRLKIDGCLRHAASSSKP